MSILYAKMEMVTVEDSGRIVAGAISNCSSSQVIYIDVEKIRRVLVVFDVYSSIGYLHLHS